MNGKPLNIKVSGVCERDIDLLLTEEFASTPEFRDWFIEQIDFHDAKGAILTEIVRSATASNGESDLVLQLHNKNGEQLQILIENKVGASFQPQQAERYHERGEANVSIGQCISFRTVLTAPLVYLGNDGSTHGFDAILSYESIREFYETHYPDTGRTQYKQYLITRAIEKSKSGYLAVEDETVSRFWEDYWNIASEIAPVLQMNKPKTKPSGSSFIYFNPSDLPSKIRLIHKVAYGFVDLQFSGMGDHLEVLNRILRPRLLSEMSILKTNKSAVVRITVPKINMVNSLDLNEGLIVDGIKSAQFLLDWFIGLELSDDELSKLTPGK